MEGWEEDLQNHCGVHIGGIVKEVQKKRSEGHSMRMLLLEAGLGDWMSQSGGINMAGWTVGLGQVNSWAKARRDEGAQPIGL